MEKRIMRKPELLRSIGLSGSTLWRLEKLGRFPGRIRLSGNSVGWFESEVMAWLKARAAERDTVPGNSSGA